MTSENTDQSESLATSNLEDTERVANSSKADQSEPSVPEFEETAEKLVRKLDTSTDRLHGVRVPVWAELGRVEMLIGDLLQLGEGSVVRLDRTVGDPVELVSQGVQLARGEVIVVDECFAIRIREILSGT